MTGVDAKKLDQVIRKFPARESSLLIPVLQAVQEEFGYIPPESIKLISRHSCVSANKIYGVMTFYAQFTTIPRGKNIIKACRGTACHVRGSSKVIEHLKAKLQVEDGHTTADNKFTLETVACLGTCFLAPAVLINNDYYGQMDEKKTDEVLKGY